MAQSKRLDLTILRNRYGLRVRLLFDHEDGQREYYKLDFPNSVCCVRTEKIEPFDTEKENHYSFIDWDGGDGYHLGWEFAGWKLVDILGVPYKGFYLGFEPI